MAILSASDCVGALLTGDKWVGGAGTGAGATTGSGTCSAAIFGSKDDTSSAGAGSVFGGSSSIAPTSSNEVSRPFAVDEGNFILLLILSVDDGLLVTFFLSRLILPELAGFRKTGSAVVGALPEDGGVNKRPLAPGNCAAGIALDTAVVGAVVDLTFMAASAANSCWSA